MKSFNKVDLYKLMNKSYDTLLGPKKNNKLSNLLDISFEDLKIIYGNWFIYCIHFVIRSGTSKSFNIENFDLNKIRNKNLNLSLEKDFLFKIYIFRTIGVWKEFNLDSILRFVKEINSINDKKNFEVIQSFNTDTILKMTLENNLKELIYDLSSKFYIKISEHKKQDLIIDFVLKNIPILFDKDILKSYKYNLNKTKDIKYSKSLYGDNIKANVLITLNRKIITRQHGLQEGMIAYNPSIFYLEKSKIDYYFYNKILIDGNLNCQKKFINWKLIIKGLSEYLNLDFLRSILQTRQRLNWTIVIYLRGGMPGQIPINEKEISHRMTKDIYDLCCNLSKKFKIIIRPAPIHNYNYSFKNFFKKLDSLVNVSVDYQRKYKINSEDIVLLNYFSSAIVERTFGKGNILLFLPNYSSYSNTNKLGNYFLAKTNLDKIIFQDIGKLINALNSLINKDKKLFLNKMVLKFKILKLLVF